MKKKKVNAYDLAECCHYTAIFGTQQQRKEQAHTCHTDGLSSKPLDPLEQVWFLNIFREGGME